MLDQIYGIGGIIFIVVLVIGGVIAFFNESGNTDSNTTKPKESTPYEESQALFTALEEERRAAAERRASFLKAVIDRIHEGGTEYIDAHCHDYVNRSSVRYYTDSSGNLKKEESGFDHICVDVEKCISSLARYQANYLLQDYDLLCLYYEDDKQAFLEHCTMEIHRLRPEEEAAKARQKEELRRREAEENLETERRRKKALVEKFRYTRIGGYNAAYRYDYYPVHSHPKGTLKDSDEANRQAIFRFKNGSPYEAVTIVTDYLDGNYSEKQMENLVLCVIPASTAYKTEARFREMCECVARKLPITNGYSFISNITDRPDSRTSGKSSDTVSHLSFSSNVKGKDVVLFDDITTRGTSFVQAADALMSKGARSVTGLFLGKTI